MMRQMKKSAFLAALAISSVLTIGNTVYAWSAGLTSARDRVAAAEKERVKLEEERKELLKDYGENHKRIKSVEEEILSLQRSILPF